MLRVFKDKITQMHKLGKTKQNKNSLITKPKERKCLSRICRDYTEPVMALNSPSWMLSDWDNRWGDTEQNLSVAYRETYVQLSLGLNMHNMSAEQASLM